MIQTKDIPGYEGLYTVNTEGQIYSFKSNRFLKCGTSTTGHKFVYLRKDGKAKMFQVHRLVAKAFIPNPKNLPVVHHIDENPQNNSVENLKWCTQKENVQYCIASGKFGKMPWGTPGKKSTISQVK